MKIGLSTSLFFKENIEESIQQLINLNIDCIEIVVEVYHFPTDKTGIPDNITKLLKSSNIDISVHASFFNLNLGSPYSEIRDLSAEMVKKSIKLCKLWDGETVVIHPGHFFWRGNEPFWKKTKSWFEEKFSECVKYARKHNVNTALENIQVPYFFYSHLKDLGQFVNEFENTGIALDIGHAYLLKKRERVDIPEEEISNEIRDLRNQIKHIHLHDNNGIRDDHLPPGEGNINFEPIIEALEEISYDKQLIMEVHGAEKPLVNAKKALKAVENLF